MIEKIIANYVHKLTKQDITNFALENQIVLTNEETILIYNTIQNHWKELIFQDHNTILNQIKSKINLNTYKKMEELIILYKRKYKNYL